MAQEVKNPQTERERSSSAEPVSSADQPDEQVLLLDPFTVTTDHEGYKANDTLGGTRVRTKLADTPSSISVITPKFMQDLGITDAEELLVYTTNTEVGGLGGNFSGISSRGFGVVGAAEGTRLSNPAGVNRSRGLTAMDNTRNYFVSQIPWDGYNISRVDISRGPNSFLFGVGSPSGISNVTTNEAHYQTKGNVEVRFGSFGSHRESLDFNKVLIPSQLAMRVDLVNDDNQYEQKPAFNHSKRIYGALRFDPKVLNTGWANTKIMANYEHGEVRSNNPRTLPPMDYYTGYFSNVNKAGYNPFTYNIGANGAPDFDPATSQWTSSADIHYAFAGGNNATFWWDAATGTLQRSSQAGVGTAAGNIGGMRGTTPNVYHIYTTGFAQYARATNYLNSNSFPGAFARTVNYLDKTMTDTSVFDFYGKLIDGPNKREWQDWDAFNVSIVQSLFNNRLTLQGVIDRQEYTRGQEGLLMGYIAPYISVDLDTHLLTYPSWSPQATANPNVGRPFIGSDFAGGNNDSTFVSDNYQLTAAYSLNFSDFVSSEGLAKTLGRHEFTGLLGRYTTTQENRTWQMYAMDGAYGQAVNAAGAQTLAARNINWVSYLGPSMANRSSAAGANLSNISNSLIPTSGPLSIFSNRWTAASSVSPTASWVNPLPTGPQTLTQADNPANYAGYQPYFANVLNSRSNIDQLYTLGNKSEQRITSKALMYQGYFWDDTIIPQIGWRSDSVRQRGNQAPINALTGVASMNYLLTDSGVTLDTTSTSYGISVHLPKAIKKNLPAGTDVTVFYFHGRNETPKVRYGIDGVILPNEEGRTDDYGVQLDGLNGRATLRLTAFKTVDNNAQASYGQPLGAAGWLIDSLPSWTLTMAAAGIAASQSSPPAGMEGNDWYWGWGRDNPALAGRIATAIQQNFPTLFPQSYWDQYGLPVSTAAIQSGNWMRVLSNGQVPFAWNVNNSHMIHGTTPIIDQNIVSKGYELEATLRPLRNWDVTFNASKVTAYQTSLGAGADRYLNGMARLWLNTDIGLTPIWGGGPARDTFMSGIWAPYLTQIALTGTDQPELRKWNFKAVSNYTFTRGVLNGLNIGGGYRWASKPVLGYGIKQTTIFGNSAWISDVAQPRYGKIDEHFDVWVGYQRKVSPKVDWKIQANLKNVGEKTHLTPISVQPDGSWAQQRIVTGMTFEVSNKFMF
jgi:hypothetical protein